MSFAAAAPEGRRGMLLAEINGVPATTHIAARLFMTKALPRQRWAAGAHGAPATAWVRTRWHRHCGSRGRRNDDGSQRQPDQLAAPE
jgi:hypothetical protein